MKKIILLLLLTISLSIFAKAQVKIGAPGIPVASAVLELSSTNRGLLIPQLSFASRNLIGSPANGLLIYQIDNTPGFYYYNGTSWVSMAPASDLVLPFIKSQSVPASALIGLTNTSATGTEGAISGISASQDASATAIKGIISSTSPGGFSSAIRGINNGTGGLGIGVYGSQAGSGWGVYGTTPSGIGVYGNCSNGFGVYGNSTAGTALYGTTSSGSALVTQGKVQFAGINEGAGKVLTSDASGFATWRLPDGGAPEVVNMLGVYAAGTTYALNDLVTSTTPDVYFFSLASSNIGNTPESSPTMWQQVEGRQLNVIHKKLTLASPGFTSLMSLVLTGTNTAGGRIQYTIRATDGGSQIATEEGIIQYLATANSITCTVQTTDKLHLGTVNSGCTPGFFNPGSHPGVSIFDNVTFSSPAPIVDHDVYFRIVPSSGYLLSGAYTNVVVRIEP